MKFAYGSTKHIQDFFAKMKTYKEEDGHVYFEGFDLMKPSFFEDIKNECSPEEGCQYLLYLNEQEEVVGILKWKRYGIPNHEYVQEDESKESYVAIRFVDVVAECRDKGVAISLIKHWSENNLRFNDKVVGGKATPKGKEVNIHRWMKRELSQDYYISENDVIEEWEENNNEYEW